MNNNINIVDNDIYLKDIYGIKMTQNNKFNKLLLISINNIDLINKYLIKKSDKHNIYTLNDKTITNLFINYNLDFDDYVMFGDIYLNNSIINNLDVLVGHKSVFIVTNKFKPAFKTKTLFMWIPYINNDSYLNVGYITTTTNNPPMCDCGLIYYNNILDNSIKFDYEFDDNESISTNNIMLVGNKFNILNLSNSLFNIDIDQIINDTNKINNISNNTNNNNNTIIERFVNLTINNRDVNRDVNINIDDNNLEDDNIDNCLDHWSNISYKGKKVILIEESNPWFKDIIVSNPLNKEINNNKKENNKNNKNNENNKNNILIKKEDNKEFNKSIINRYKKEMKEIYKLRRKRLLQLLFLIILIIIVIYFIKEKNKKN